ncbi:MAG: EscU/YscU/HrcU family type III secretion system export apparatus switch protein [Bacillota bacterium]
MEKAPGTPLEVAALKYAPENDDAPVIVALGRGEVARQIMLRAHEYDIPVVEDAQTAGILNRFRVGDTIPPELYAAVAKILVFISRMDAEYAQKMGL